MTTATNVCACGKPTAGAHLCERCTRTFSYALVNTLAYYLELDTVERKATRFGDPAGGTRTIGKSQPLIVDHRFIENHRTYQDPDTKRTITVGQGSGLRAAVETTITTWTDRCTPHHTDPAPATISGSIAWLAHHTRFRWILRQPWATDMLADFLTLERQLTRMIDRPPDNWYAGKCSAPLPPTDTNPHPGICERELYARVNSGFIDCPGCKTRHDVGERREILLREAQNILVTATEAAQALIAWTDYDGSETKLVDRIRKWRDRDRLEVQDVTELRGQDRHLYRLGDIQALLIESAQQQQAKRVTGT